MLLTGELQSLRLLTGELHSLRLVVDDSLIIERMGRKPKHADESY